MKKLVFLLVMGVVFNGCSILSKVYVRNYYEHEITLEVKNLWIKEKVRTNTNTWAYYTPKIVTIKSNTYKMLTDSLAMQYDAKGTLSIKIPAKSTVLLEVMHNSGPSNNIEIYVSGKPQGASKTQILAEYSIDDVKYKSFHKYCLDIKP